MNLASIVLIGGLLVLMLLSVPIIFSLGISSIASVFIDGRISLMLFPQRIFGGLDSFPLMAIIFFLISGEFMMQGGITRRLINFVKIFFGWVRGSLSLVSFAASALFGAISGSAPATTAAIGGIMYPEMIKDGAYPKYFTASVQAVAGTLGTMIPPSIPLIIYGTVTNASIGNLFIATIIPGIVMMTIYMLTAQFIILKKGYAKIDNKEKEKEKINVWKVLKEAIWALLAPIIILGGIYSGLFTPTESAAISCGYALIIGLFVYKELDMKKIYKCILSSCITSASIMLLSSTASYFGFAMTTQGIPQKITEFLLTSINSEVVFLLVANLILIICGMFVDATTSILLVVPLLFPAALQFGVDPVHFGIITGINLSVGIMSPPFGICLFVANGLDRSLKLQGIYKEVIPFFIFAIVGILIITFVEPLSFILLGD